MRYSKEVRDFVSYRITGYTLKSFKEGIGAIIHTLSKEDHAESNINQILFYTKVLHYLKYKYNEKESS